MPASYWKDLAEERRVKLDKALEENKDLSEMLQVIKKKRKNWNYILSKKLQTRQEEITELEEERDVLMKENKILRAKAQKVPKSFYKNLFF